MKTEGVDGLFVDDSKVFLNDWGFAGWIYFERP